MSSPSHEIFLTSSPNGLITVYDTISGNVLARFTGSRSPRHGLALLGKVYIAASHISSATACGSIHLYNWWSPSALHYLSVPEPVAPLVATPDGSYLFAGGLSGNVYALSVPSGNIAKSIPAHKKSVSSLTISSDCSLLISGGDDGTIVVMPIFLLVQAAIDENSDSSNLMLQSFLAHNGPVTAITSCNLHHPTIVSCSTDCTCKLWSLLDGRNLHTVAFPCAISGIELDQTEAKFYAAGSDGLIYKGSFKVRSKKEENQLVALGAKHGGAVVSVVLANERKNLISAAEDGSVYIREIERGEVIMVVGDHHNMEGISDVALAKGIGGMGNQMNEYYSGLSSKEFSSRPIKDVVDIENVLNVAANDKRKAINMLESAIGMYERLLKLILKESKGGLATQLNTEKE